MQRIHPEGEDASSFEAQAAAPQVQPRLTSAAMRANAQAAQAQPVLGSQQGGREPTKVSTTRSKLSSSLCSCVLLSVTALWSCQIVSGHSVPASRCPGCSGPARAGLPAGRQGANQGEQEGLTFAGSCLWAVLSVKVQWCCESVSRRKIVCTQHLRPWPTTALIYDWARSLKRFRGRKYRPLALAVSILLLCMCTHIHSNLELWSTGVPAQAWARRASGKQNHTVCHITHVVHGVRRGLCVQNLEAVEHRGASTGLGEKSFREKKHRTAEEAEQRSFQAEVLRELNRLAAAPASEVEVKFSNLYVT